MGKSNQGGVFGYIRGKVGSVSYSVQSAKNSSTGKKQQVVRALPESVSNPQTVGQVMQRMKLAPAQRFYAAFATMLSNAFQGVEYGDASRRHFISKCMQLDGPYVQRGVDRFIPAEYPFSEGSIPSVTILPFSGGASFITIDKTAEAVPTLAEFAAALQVTTDYQISIAVVNNINGVFQPSYISYEERLKIADMPANALGIDEENHITVNPAAFGLDVSAMVACVIVLSTQDASGVWLRSSQTMVISNELRDSLYSPTALEAAIYSYQDSTGAANSINSEWYYNLGMSQAWPGKLITSLLPIDQTGELADANVVVGMKQVDGVIRKYVFATSTEDTGLIICVLNGTIITWPQATVNEFKGLNAGYTVELWNAAYATQLGVAAGNPGGFEPFTVKGYVGDNGSDITIVDVIYPSAGDITPIYMIADDGYGWVIQSDDTSNRSYQLVLKNKNGYEYSGSDGEFEKAWMAIPADVTRIVPICPSNTYQKEGAKENWQTIAAQLGVSSNIWVHVE